MEKENSYKDAAQHYEQVFKIYSLCLIARKIYTWFYALDYKTIFIYNRRGDSVIKQIPPLDTNWHLIT